MFDNKHKYVRLKEYDQFIFFPIITEHSKFKHLNPISAGFCYLNNEDKRLRCFGESHSLGIGAMEDDTNLATIQVYGIDLLQRSSGSYYLLKAGDYIQLGDEYREEDGSWHKTGQIDKKYNPSKHYKHRRLK